MSSANSLFNSFFIFLFSIVFAFVLDVSVGHAIDEFLLSISFIAARMGDPGGAFDTSSMLAQFVGNFHLLIYLIPAMGLAQFIYTAIRRTRYEQYEESYYT